MAWHDSLTGLPNRRLFEDRVEQELVRSRRVGEPVCMFFVDLDNFKTVNDTYGHATGDVLIQQVGQRLVDDRPQPGHGGPGWRRRVRHPLARPGRPARDQPAGRAHARRMHTPFAIFGDRGVHLGVASAIAIAPRARRHLRRPAEPGRRGHVPGEGPWGATPSRCSAARPGVPRATALRRPPALRRPAPGPGRQPVLPALPALHRPPRPAQIGVSRPWSAGTTPPSGSLEPPHFIPMAEQSDLIVALDDTGSSGRPAASCARWRDHGLHPLRLSVNLSRDATCSSPDFFDTVVRTLHDTGVDPQLLELEITEPGRPRHSRGPPPTTSSGCERPGVRFTIDDFGSGTSSLDRIGAFPVSTLKIDQSFVQVLGPTDEEDRLVSAIIAMADRLGLDCVAEGVETSHSPGCSSSGAARRPRATTSAPRSCPATSPGCSRLRPRPIPPSPPDPAPPPRPPGSMASSGPQLRSRRFGHPPILRTSAVASAQAGPGPRGPWGTPAFGEEP